MRSACNPHTSDPHQLWDLAPAKPPFHLFIFQVCSRHIKHICRFKSRLRMILTPVLLKNVKVKHFQAGGSKAVYDFEKAYCEINFLKDNFVSIMICFSINFYTRLFVKTSLMGELWYIFIFSRFYPKQLTNEDNKSHQNQQKSNM